MKHDAELPISPAQLRRHRVTVAQFKPYQDQRPATQQMDAQAWALVRASLFQNWAFVAEMDAAVAAVAESRR